MDHDCAPPPTLRERLEAERERLRVWASAVTDAVTTIPMPQTFAEACRAYRAGEIADRFLCRVYADPAEAKPAASQASGRTRMGGNGSDREDDEDSRHADWVRHQYFKRRGEERAAQARQTVATTQSETKSTEPSDSRPARDAFEQDPGEQVLDPEDLDPEDLRPQDVRPQGLRPMYPPDFEIAFTPESLAVADWSIPPFSDYFDPCPKEDDDAWLDEEDGIDRAYWAEMIQQRVDKRQADLIAVGRHDVDPWPPDITLTLHIHWALRHNARAAQENPPGPFVAVPIIPSRLRDMFPNAPPQPIPEDPPPDMPSSLRRL